MIEVFTIDDIPHVLAATAVREADLTTLNGSERIAESPGNSLR
jgi:hypothetical protein